MKNITKIILVLAFTLMAHTTQAQEMSWKIEYLLMYEDDDWGDTQDAYAIVDAYADSIVIHKLKSKEVMYLLYDRVVVDEIDDHVTLQGYYLDGDGQEISVLILAPKDQTDYAKIIFTYKFNLSFALVGKRIR